jgi:hypothetical protein
MADTWRIVERKTVPPKQVYDSEDEAIQALMSYPDADRFVLVKISDDDDGQDDRPRPVKRVAVVSPERIDAARDRHVVQSPERPA